ncbi:WD40 repeat domain-containing protein [bacterium CPR1]|nr:WD40 repeat domain-containing protein [bacterium CPR1]
MKATWGEEASGSESAVLSDDGQWMAVASGSEIAWRAALTGQELERLEAGSTRVLCLALAAESSFLLAGSDEGQEVTLRRYRRQEESWTLDSEFEAHRSTTALAVARDGQVFASGGGEGIFTVWSREGADLWSAEGPGAIGALAFSPDGNQLAVARPERVEVWSREGEPLWSASAGSQPLALAFSPDGQWILSSWPEGLQRMRSGEVEASPGLHFVGPALEPQAVFSGQTWFGPGVSSGGALRLCCRQGLDVWRDQYRLWRSAPVEELIVGSGRILSCGGQQLVVRDSQGHELARHRSSSNLGKLGFSPGGRLGGWCTSTELVVVELEGGSVLARAPQRNLAFEVGNRLEFAKLLVYPDWKLESEVSLEEWSDVVAPKHVLAGLDQICLPLPEGGYRRARLRDGETEQTFYWSCQVDRHQVRGSFLVAWNHEAIVRWRLETGELVDVTPCPSAGLAGVAVSPDAQRAMALSEGWARLYDLSEQKLLGSLCLLQGGDSPTVVAAFDQDSFLVGMSQGRLHLICQV